MLETLYLCGFSAPCHYSPCLRISAKGPRYFPRYGFSPRADKTGPGLPLAPQRERGPNWLSAIRSRSKLGHLFTALAGQKKTAQGKIEDHGGGGKSQRSENGYPNRRYAAVIPRETLES
jgi:hypothetical protein